MTECALLTEARRVAEPGATIADRGQSAVVEGADRRFVIAVRLDADAGRGLLAVDDRVPVCDGLFLFLDEEPWRGVLVELKGRSVGDAPEQLESTLAAVRRRLATECPTPPPLTWDAVIVCREAAPGMRWQRTRSELLKRFRSVEQRSGRRYVVRGRR